MMNSEIHMHDTVALLEDIDTVHFETGAALKLRRGQMGAVVMTYDGSAVEVEFSSRDGKTYALLPVKTDRLIVLRDTPELAAAC